MRRKEIKRKRKRERRDEKKKRKRNQNQRRSDREAIETIQFNGKLQLSLNAPPVAGCGQSFPWPASRDPELRQ